MANLIDTFLNQLTAEEKRDKTREQYGGNLRRFERWLLETHSLLLDEERISRDSQRAFPSASPLSSHHHR